MLELTEPQVWVLIGVFAAAIFGMVGIVTTGLNRTLTSAIGGLRAELRAELGGLRSEIGGLRAEMNARFETVDAKFETLDRDIQALTRHVFGSDSR